MVNDIDYFQQRLIDLEKENESLRIENESLKKNFLPDMNVADALKILDSVASKLKVEGKYVDQIKQIFIDDYFNGGKLSYVYHESSGQYVSRYELNQSNQYKRYYSLDKLVRGELFFLFNSLRVKHLLGL